MLQNFKDKIGYSVKLKSPSADCSSQFSTPEEPLESNFLCILSQYCNAYTGIYRISPLFKKHWYSHIMHIFLYFFFHFTYYLVQFNSVQSLSHVQLFATPWTAARQASLSITNSQSPPKPMSIESVMPSNHLILCRPFLLLPSIFPSIRVFSNESALWIRWPKYWSFSFNISPSNEHPGLISFSMDWLDLPAVQGTLESLLQHHSSKASFFSAQLSL